MFRGSAGAGSGGFSGLRGGSSASGAGSRGGGARGLVSARHLRRSQRRRNRLSRIAAGGAGAHDHHRLAARGWVGPGPAIPPRGERHRASDTHTPAPPRIGSSRHVAAAASVDGDIVGPVLRDIGVILRSTADSMPRRQLAARPRASAATARTIATGSIGLATYAWNPAANAGSRSVACP